MRILHIGKYYPPSLGGMETVLRNLAEGLLDRSGDLTVLTAGHDPQDSQEILTGPLSGHRGRLVRAGVFGHLNSQPLTLNLMGLMRREINLLEPDLVHLHLPNPLAGAAWMALDSWPGIELPPLAVWYHADITRQRLGKILVQPVVNGCLSRCRGVSVSSATLKDKSPVLAPWREKVEVIPFGIDPGPWNGPPSTLEGPFLFVGRLVPYKGLDVLVRAMVRVPEAELVIVGEGPLAASLSELATVCGVADRIHFAGPMDQDGVAVHLARARALVLPSIDSSETFGLVQLEAMAAGVPVITSDLPTGVREVGEPGRTCRLVTPGDSEALAVAMNDLQADTTLAREMGSGGRQRFLEKFTREKMIDRLCHWYSSLAAGKDGGLS